MGGCDSHYVVLPLRVFISLYLGYQFFIGAIVFGLLASATTHSGIKSYPTIKSDTAIGITFSSFLSSLALILIGVANSSNDISHIPFGNILAVQDLICG